MKSDNLRKCRYVRRPEICTRWLHERPRLMLFRTLKLDMAVGGVRACYTACGNAWRPLASISLCSQPTAILTCCSFFILSCVWVILILLYTGFELVTGYVGHLTLIITIDSSISLFLTICSSRRHSLSLLGMIYLHYCSSTGYQRRTFPLLRVFELFPCQSHSNSWSIINSTPVFISNNSLPCSIIVLHSNNPLK